MQFNRDKLSGRAKEAYTYILGQIMSGELKINDPVSELEMTKKLNSSRTPIREAMVVLEQDGLLIRQPNRGCYVADITVQDIEEIFTLRKLLETYAMSVACEIVAEEDVQEIYDRTMQLSENDDPEEFFETDRELHAMIVQHCGNRRLIQVLDTLNMQSERVRVMAARKPARLKASRQEHLEILQAMLEHDVNKAIEKLGIHIEHVGESAIAMRRMLL